jgi:UPF0755 protein
MKTLLRLFVLLVLAGAFLMYRAVSPYQGFSGEVFVDVPHGTGARGIADLLARAGVVRTRWDFLLARTFERGRVLQAGEYKFDRKASAIEIFDRVARGDVFHYELVVPEGKNMFDIAVIGAQLGLFTADQFLAVARNPSMIRDLDPEAPSLEGYLFPNTYKVSRHISPERLCRTMTGKFRDVWHGLHATVRVHDAVTLASLVEKEGKMADERPQIAAVFANRLKMGMKLDCDPTTIYAALLANRYRGVIHRSDLDSLDPYNTYRHAGLPPGPIANPGLASIKAALKPADTDAIFFVLKPDGSGHHEFTNNIAAHSAATAKYRRAQQR